MQPDTPILVTGAGGFIGGHLCRRLAERHTNILGVDIKPLDEWWQRPAGVVCRRFDLRRESACSVAVEGRQVIFNLACDMGGMGFIEPNKALCMRNVLINTHLIEAARRVDASYFYASSACVYPARLQNGHARALTETDAYPAESEPGYGWEKLFSEQVCQHYYRDYDLDVHIGRFHTIYGPHGTWTGGREKVPAALCRKVAAGDVVEVWGDGHQERSLPASYAVRCFGVHSAMPMTEALRRCPHAICIPPRMARYQEVSAQVFEIFHEFTPLVEGLSLDEAFLDVTASLRLMGDGTIIAIEVRRRIREATGLTASVGIGPNKLLAKIASDLNKPDGLCRIGSDNVHAILDRLPVQKLFGVGQKSLPGVQAAGIQTVGDLRHAADATLWRAFGKHGKAMRDRAAGLDDRPVEPNREEKSISAEETFAVDIRGAAELERQLTQLADRAATRLRSHALAAGLVTIKVRRGDFTTYTRQRPVLPPTQETAVICGVAQSLLKDWLRSQPHAAVRLLGVGVGDLQIQRQADLFAGDAQPSRLDATVDGIRERFGKSLLTRASLLPRNPSGGSRHD